MLLVDIILTEKVENNNKPLTHSSESIKFAIERKNNLSHEFEKPLFTLVKNKIERQIITSNVKVWKNEIELIDESIERLFLLGIGYSEG